MKDTNTNLDKAVEYFKGSKKLKLLTSKAYMLKWDNGDCV